MQSLVKLDVSGNRLKTLPPSFYKLFMHQVPRYYTHNRNGKVIYDHHCLLPRKKHRHKTPQGAVFFSWNILWDIRPVFRETTAKFKPRLWASYNPDLEPALREPLEQHRFWEVHDLLWYRAGEIEALKALVDNNNNNNSGGGGETARTAVEGRRSPSSLRKLQAAHAIAVKLAQRRRAHRARRSLQRRRDRWRSFAREMKCTP